MRPPRAERLNAEAERQLEAIDRALAGETVDPDLTALATLTADLRAERPTPESGWGAELDRRALDGFPSTAAGQGRGRGARVRSALRRPRLGLLAPAGALATLVVAVLVALPLVRDGSTGETLDSSGIETTGPESGGAPSPDSSSAGSGPATAGGVADSGAPSQAGGSVSGYSSRDGQSSKQSLDGARAGKLAPGARKRIEDRSAQLVLSTETKKVGQVSDDAISIVEGIGGVVTSSNLSEQGARAEADLELSIPTRELDSTLDKLTDLATVRSINEASTDITKPFVSTRDRLRDARAERQKLLEALGNATTDAEIASVRKQLADARKRLSRTESDFQKVARQGRMADISLRIEGRAAADDGAWSLGDAANDALGVLRTVLGVLLVSLAVLVPTALIAALAAFGLIAVRRRSRERALEA